MQVGRSTFTLTLHLEWVVGSSPHYQQSLRTKCKSAIVYNSNNNSSQSNHFKELRQNSHSLVDCDYWLGEHETVWPTHRVRKSRVLRTVRLNRNCFTHTQLNFPRLLRIEIEACTKGQIDLYASRMGSPTPLETPPPFLSERRTTLKFSQRYEHKFPTAVREPPSR